MPLARQFLIVNYSFIQFDTDFSGQIEFPEFCNMMSAKMGTVNDEDMIRMAFRVLSKDGSGTIKSSAFKHLMTHIDKANAPYTGFKLDKTAAYFV